MKKNRNTWQFSVRSFFLGLVGILGSMLMASCEKEALDVQEIFPFEVKVMPVPKEIAIGEMVEIRISIISKGDYAGNKFNIRYFQYDGQGTLRYFGDKPYLPNDLYQLVEKEFQLYYTSESLVSQNFSIWISDSFGNEKQISFEFSNKKVGPVIRPVR